MVSVVADKGLVGERAIMPDLVSGRLMVTTKELWKSQLSTLVDSRVSL